ncbi:hypothetical protein ACOMHN_067436 [Nucella lapillus]
MALCSTYRVSPGQLFSSIGWIKRGFPSCTQPAPSTHQRQIISLPFVLKQSRLFSISQCALRLANENGFLSWCRNSYLTTVVAIAMLAEGTTPLAMQAAEGAFFVAGLNLTWGTYQYIYNLLRLRRRTGVSAVGALLYSSMALLHIGLWLIVCTLFLGYTDDDADGKPVKEETRNPGSTGGDV